MYVRGDDAGRVSPFATSIGRIAALTKDKNAAVALNDVNGGGIDEFFLILRSLDCQQVIGHLVKR